MATFTSKINGNSIYAERAERTRSGLLFETLSDEYGILPSGLANDPTEDQEGKPLDRVDAHTLATQQYVLDQMGSVAEALIFKGTIGAAADTPTVTELPATHKIGWTYKVATAGTYAGKVCELGDMIICVKNGTVAADADWTVVQNNIDGAVTGPVSATDNAIALFNNTTGKVIKDSGITIETTLSASSDVKVPTSKAVNDAITGAVNALDITDISNTAGKTVATITEQDGIVGATFQDIAITSSQISDLTDNYTGTGTTAITDKAVKAAIDALNVTSVGGAGKYISAISETDGKISATASDMDTAPTANSTNAVTSGGVKTYVDGAIADLYVSDVVGDSSGSMAGKTLLTLSETDGKIAATFQDISIVSSQISDLASTYSASGTVAVNGTAVTAALATLDASETGSNNGVSVTVTETDGKITGVSVTAAQAEAGSSTPGLVTYETVDLY